MGTRIAAALALVALLIGGYYVWQHYKVERQSADGDVHWVTGQPSPEEHARFLKENSGDTADGQSEHKDRTARQEDAAGFPDTTATTTTTTTTPAPAATTTYNNVPATSTTQQTTTTQVSSSNRAAAPAGLPVSDSLSPNAPNGMRFVSSGKFQWYRQGNITWREDTETGRSCIAYATLEEWAKQIVASHGCGRDI